MAVPKRRTSKARKRARRAHDGLSITSVSSCVKCGEPRLPHRYCAACGYYKDRYIKDIPQETA